MMHSITRSKKKEESSRAARILRGAAAAVFWLLVWELAARCVGREILLVSPGAVARRLWQLMGEPSFYATLMTSIGRIMAGFLLALICGALLAVLCRASSLARALFVPLLGIVKATPVASFIILALVWIPSGRVPVFISFLIVVPVVWANVSAGLERVDVRLLEMAHMYGFSPMKKLRAVYLPSVLPHFVAAASAGLGLAWKSGVAAEVLARPRLSVGSALYNAKIYIETADLFAWTAVVVVLSMLLEKLLLGGLRALVARLRLRMEVK